MADDRALVLQVLSGDREAFKQLISQNERLVMHMIGRLVKRPEEQEELCQDVFLRVFNKLRDFNFQSRLSTWIATIAYRHALNYIRKQERTGWNDPVEDKVLLQMPASEDVAGKVEEQDLEEKIMQYVNQLPPHYRIVLTLYHLDGMKYPEIAEIMSMPEGTVKSYLFRARKLLKDKVLLHLGGEGINE